MDLPLLAQAVTDARPSLLADTATIGLIVGVFAPLLTSVVQQPRWSQRTRAVIGALVSVLLGIGVCAVNGVFSDPSAFATGQTLLATVAAVLVASQSAYRGMWKQTGISPAIEVATSPNPKPPSGV